MLKKQLFFILAGLMFVSFPATARADAVFVSSASTSITLVGFRDSSGIALVTAPSALTLTSQVTFLSPSFTERGNASTNLNGIGMAGNGNLRFVTFASGQAGADAGFAAGSWETGGIVTIQNSSLTEGFFVDYVVAMQYLLSASFDPALNESANAGLTLNIATAPNNLLVTFSDQQISPGFTDPEADFFVRTFSIFVPAGASIGFGAGLGIGGSAQVVPEPTTMLLLGTGLAGVVLRTRKRFKNRKSK